MLLNQWSPGYTIKWKKQCGKKRKEHAANYILKFILKNGRINHKVKKSYSLRKEGDCVKVMGSDVKFFWILLVLNIWLRIVYKVYITKKQNQILGKEILKPWKQKWV